MPNLSLAKSCAFKMKCRKSKFEKENFIRVREGFSNFKEQWFKKD